MKFRSIADMDRLIMENIHTIPRDIDLIVGVPRSGLLPASIVALNLNIPMADLNGFLEGRIFGIGSTRRTGKEISSIDDVKSVLIVDDSVSSGRSILQIKERLAEIGSRVDVRFLAVYVAPGAESFVDFGLEVLTNPRVFQWNVMHHNFLE